MDFSHIGPSECALVALAATTGESLERIQELANEVALLATIRSRGTAPTETCRLLNLVGVQASTSYEHEGVRLAAYLDWLEWEGKTHAIICVWAKTEFHAVSIGPQGYVDLLEQPPGVYRTDDPRWVHGRRPLQGAGRHVRWAIAW